MSVKTLDSTTEAGVMVISPCGKKAWGTLYDDGKSRAEGWTKPCWAELHDPRFCKKPTDVTWKGSPYRKELEKGTLMEVIVTKVVTAVAEEEE